MHTCVACISAFAYLRFLCVLIFATHVKTENTEIRREQINLPPHPSRPNRQPSRKPGRAPDEDASHLPDRLVLRVPSCQESPPRDRNQSAADAARRTLTLASSRRRCATLLRKVRRGRPRSLRDPAPLLRTA